MSFAGLPALELVAGSTTTVELSDFLHGAAASRAFAVTGAVHVGIDLDGDHGRLRVSAPSGFQGHEVLLVSAVDETGRRATATLRVTVAHDVGALTVLPLPRVSLAAGDSFVVDLAVYAASAVGPIVWSATTSSELLTVEMRKQHLWMHAADAVGQATVAIAVADARGPGVGRSLQVIVLGVDPVSGSSISIQPLEVAVAVGDSAHVALESLLSGLDAAWVVADDGGLDLRIDDGKMTVAAVDPALTGWRTVVLEARLTEETLRVAVDVAVMPSPRLLLRTPAERVLTAGTVDSTLNLQDLVAVGVAAEVTWTVTVDGLRVVGTITADGHLRLDGRRGLPGREVLGLRAEHAGERRQLTLAIRVEVPILEVTDVGVVTADTVIAVDAWGSDPRLPPLSWVVQEAPSGVHAAWDSNGRNLRIEGQGTGVVRLSAQLESGLQVAQVSVPVQLGSARLETPEGQPADPEGVDAESGPPWRLVAVTIPLTEPDAVVRLPLSTLVEGVESGSLAWSVQPPGAAYIDAGVLVVKATGSGSIRLLATDVFGTTRDLAVDVPVVIEAAMPPPGIDVRVQLVATAGGPGLRTQIDAEGELEARIDGQPMTAATSILLLSEDLPRHPVEIAAEARRGQATSRAEIRLAVGMFGEGGGRLVSVDGAFEVHIPAGAGGQTAVLIARTEEGHHRIERLGPAVPLGLWFRQAGTEPWAAVEAWEQGHWAPLPGARPTAVPSGILAHTGAETVNGVFRPQSGGRLASGEAHAFPNPFNAAVSLPVPGDSDRVEIFDLLGRRIRLFELGPGTPAVIWTGQDDAGRAVASGVYLFRVSGRGDPRTGRLTLIR